MSDKKNDKFELVDLVLSTQTALGFGMAFLDPKTGRILRSNAVFCSIFGYSDKELGGMPSFASLLNTDHQTNFRESFRNLEGAATFETVAMSKTRSRLWIEVRLRQLRLRNEVHLAAIVTDITRRREAEEQVLLLETITLAVNEARDFQSALSVAVRKVCVATGWEYGLAWVPAADGKTLAVSRSSYGGSDRLEQFRRAMSEITLSPGDDLPGRAMALRQPQWADDVMLLRSFRRQAIMREFGVQISMAIPVVAEGKVAAVLEFCVTEKHLQIKDFFVGLASAIAPQLGSVFQRKKAEEQRDRFFAMSPDLISIAGVDGYFRELNPAWTELLGYSIEELKSKPFYEFIHPEDRERSRQAVEKMKTSKVATGHFENRYVAKDGSIRWLLWNGALFEDEQLMYATARDMTDRNAAEDEIHRANEFLDQIIENIPDMIFIKDAKDLRFVRFNKAGEKLLGVERGSLIGKNDYDFFPPDEADFFTAKDREVLEEGKLVDIAEEVIHTKAGVRVLHTKKIPIWDSGKKPVYLLGISEDVTDRKKTD